MGGGERERSPFCWARVNADKFSARTLSNPRRFEVANYTGGVAGIP